MSYRIAYMKLSKVALTEKISKYNPNCLFKHHNAVISSKIIKNTPQKAYFSKH